MNDESSPDATPSDAHAPDAADAADAADALDASDAAGDAGPSTDVPATDAAVPDADASFPFPTPIRYVVVIVKENHTFDNYFTGFPGTDSVNVAPQTGIGNIARHPLPNADLFGDISHTHESGVRAWDHGRMDNFIRPITGPLPAGAPSNWRYATFNYYPQAQIPNYWALARHYVLFDRFFSTALAPSDPGHTATIAAQTPILDNGQCPAGVTACNYRCAASTTRPAVFETFSTTACRTTTHTGGCYTMHAVPQVLPAGITWRAYGRGTGHAIATPFQHIHGIDDVPATIATHYWSFEQFAADARGGTTMANVSFLNSFAGANSEHPPYHPCEGENYTISLINDVMAGPHWHETAIILTWDDWGGWYDHVHPANDACGTTEHFNTGFRLPALVISPWARGGVVVHDVTEQASIPRLIEDLFNPAGTTARRLHDSSPTARDTTAGSMMHAFDFTPGRTLVPDIHLATHACAANGGVAP